ncbi:hypothetical protein PV05_03580 [Exophiala xenobiotica]|uniref:Uncharacterized protein n=1 Tax=Exophiala xenobiotica TaxID=348802 RepID=A0A0D2EWF7_9EURO|nr:uncharacterized protein PV05_03580 [Exophiala xenobiotica]KIW59105.1 hypothetical protein PV05_03580 [Exophiala xenobiotica]
MAQPTTTQDLHNNFEPHPNAHDLTGKDTSANNTSKVDYEPHPDRSVATSPEHKDIIKHITNLYCGSASESDMQVYAEKAIYDDPLSYCDTRYKIAGQWYGLPMIFSSLRTLATEVVKDSSDEIIFKLRQEYTPKVTHTPKTVDSLVSLGLDEHGKVRYHKDMWNDKDYSHQGLGKLIKTLNGDHLTKITQPPESL